MGKLSIFSGLNSLNDISMDEEFSSLCGISETDLEYSYKKFRWSFSCRNLLGVQDYVYSTISPVGSFQTRYRIRPRMFFLKMSVTL